MINQRAVGSETLFPAAVLALATVELLVERENESKKGLKECACLAILEPATA
jgi:hypothetical protein